MSLLERMGKADPSAKSQEENNSSGTQAWAQSLFANKNGGKVPNESEVTPKHVEPERKPEPQQAVAPETQAAPRPEVVKTDTTAQPAQPKRGSLMEMLGNQNRESTRQETENPAPVRPQESVPPRSAASIERAEQKKASMSARKQAEYTKIAEGTHREVAAILSRMDSTNPKEIEALIGDVIDDNNPEMKRVDKARLVKEVLHEITGLGPLEELIQDQEVSEIMVNGPKQIYVERKGKLTKSDVTFQDEEHVRRIIDRIVAPLGRRIDDSNPMVDARLADGSRVNAIIPPLALCGSTITIRKFSSTPLTVQNLIGFGSLSDDMAEFLEAAVHGKLNILVSGGTGSGKTTLLNVLSAFIPADERIVTIEDAAELRLMQDHVVSLESRPANLEGTGAVTIRDLVKNALRMRPDRIVVGEVRGGETVDMLQAMNTGHDGSLTTAHANSARDALLRIETMFMMAGMEIPVTAIRQQIAGALDLIVQQARLRDGSRKIISISEVTGMEGDIITTQEVFRYTNEGYDENRKSIGSFVSTGVKPKCCDKMMANGVEIKDEWFFEPNLGI